MNGAAVSRSLPMSYAIAVPLFINLPNPGMMGLFRRLLMDGSLCLIRDTKTSQRKRRSLNENGFRILDNYSNSRKNMSAKGGIAFEFIRWMCLELNLRLFLKVDAK